LASAFGAILTEEEPGAGLPKEAGTMWEFLEAYGYWIFLGVLLILMLRMHAGGGCGMGHGGHGTHDVKSTSPEANQRSGARPTQTTGSRTGHH
jgi:hypothetical protein